MVSNVAVHKKKKKAQAIFHMAGATILILDITTPLDIPVHMYVFKHKNKN